MCVKQNLNRYVVPTLKMICNKGIEVIRLEWQIIFHNLCDFFNDNQREGEKVI